MIKILLLLPLLLLPSCVPNRSGNIETELPRLDERVERGCVQPLLLPEKNLSQFEVEKYWASDRAALVTCKSTQQLTVDYYNSVRTGLGAK